MKGDKVSYDIKMYEPHNRNQVIKFNKPHHFRGGTYAMGGTNEAWINITYNYADFYHDTIDKEKGIRWLYGKTGEEVLPILQQAIKKLGLEPSDNYWKATAGNAGDALLALKTFCVLRPDGIFDGD
jgi:hypothetical protein